MKEKEFFNEKNLSTKQKTSSKDPWISSKDENGIRTQDNQPSQKTRAQKTCCVKYKFPKKFRILKRNDFKKIALKRVRLKSKYIIVDYIFDLSKPARMGIAASKKYGKAHVRNRFKRITKEAFRLLIPTISLPVSFLVRPTLKAKNAKMQDIQKDLLYFFKRISKNDF